MYANHVVLSGRVMTDPKQRNEKAPVEFRIGVSRSYKDKETGEWVTAESGFYTVVCWDTKHGSLVAKGEDVTVVGRLDHQEYEKDGQKRERVQVVASTVTVLPSENIEW